MPRRLLMVLSREPDRRSIMAVPELTAPFRARLIGTLIAAADAARPEILSRFRRAPPVTNKAGAGRFDPVTDADRAAERAITGIITARHPGHAIIGEEFGTQTANQAVAGAREPTLTWVVDPVDGTRAFIAGAPTWGTLIGVGHVERPLLGLMDQAYTRDRYLGLPGGAFDIGPGGPCPLRTAPTERLEDAILSATAPEMFAPGTEAEAFARVSRVARLTRYGLDCTAYCLLAAGHIDAVVEAGMKIYDIYPLIPIVTGAGGLVTDWQGGPAHNGGRIAAAATPALHARLLETLSRL